METSKPWSTGTEPILTQYTAIVNFSWHVFIQVIIYVLQYMLHILTIMPSILYGGAQLCTEKRIYLTLSVSPFQLLNIIQHFIFVSHECWI